ncbi:MAG: Hg(II)-responsive transcriptional regulator [Vicinamibacterales bacterium]
MIKPGDSTIGEIAAAANVSVETIRFYQRRGLLTEPRRAYGQIRRYGASDVARVKFVKSAQRLGFSLEEVAALLRLDDGAHCGEARVMAAQKLDDVRSKLRDLRRIESVLKKLVADCGSRQGSITCPLISALHARESPARSRA